MGRYYTNPQSFIAPNTYQPLPVDIYQSALNNLQQRYDTAQQMQAAKMDQIASEEYRDQKSRDYVLGKFKQDLSNIAKEHGNDLGRGLGDLTARIGQEKMNPYYGLNKYQVEQAKLFEEARLKNPSAFVGFKNPAEISLYSNINATGSPVWRNTKDLTADVGYREDLVDYTHKKFAGIKPDSLMKLGKGMIPGYYTVDDIKGITRNKIDEIVSDSAAEDAMKDNSILTREMKELKGMSDSGIKEYYKQAMRNQLYAQVFSEIDKKFIEDKSLDNALKLEKLNYLRAKGKGSGSGDVISEYPNLPPKSTLPLTSQSFAVKNKFALDPKNFDKLYTSDGKLNPAYEKNTLATDIVGGFQNAGTGGSVFNMAKNLLQGGSNSEIYKEHKNLIERGRKYGLTGDDKTIAMQMASAENNLGIEGYGVMKSMNPETNKMLEQAITSNLGSKKIVMLGSDYKDQEGATNLSSVLDSKDKQEAFKKTMQVIGLAAPNPHTPGYAVSWFDTDGKQKTAIVQGDNPELKAFEKSSRLSNLMYNADIREKGSIEIPGYRKGEKLEGILQLVPTDDDGYKYMEFVGQKDKDGNYIPWDKSGRKYITLDDLYMLELNTLANSGFSGSDVYMRYLKWDKPAHGYYTPGKTTQGLNDDIEEDSVE